MKEIIIEIMKSYNVKGNQNDFVEAMIDILSEYAEHIEQTEPYATKSIASLNGAKECLMGLWMSEELD